MISLPDSSAVTRSIVKIMNSDSATTLADVTLISSDEVPIPAVRALLAAGSLYFRTLFTSNFAEKNIPTVRLSITARSIREIIEFIYTDDCALVRNIRELEEDYSSVSCENVRALLQLASAADYTAVDELASRCEEVLRSIMQDIKHVASIVVDELAQRNLSWGSELLDEALLFCRKETDDTLFVQNGDLCLQYGLMHLSERGAQEVFSHLHDQGTDLQALFEVLVGWATGGTAVAPDWIPVHWDTVLTRIDAEALKLQQDRLKPAKRFALSFDLSELQTGFVANIAERCGLAETEQLCAAYKKHALEFDDSQKRKHKRQV